jgi:hypothetical protein
MADNYINVTVTSKQNKRVTVSTQEPGFEVTATTDTGKFWAQTAENWATSDTIVENKDYSSKYYANKAKVNAENARVYEASVKETYNSLIAESNGISNEIRTTGNEVIDNINSTKTNIIQDIEFVADGEKKEIEDLIDSGKEELKESIGDVKVLTTLEIGDIGFTQMAIDESKGKRRILNGQVIIQDQYVQFTNIIKQSVALNPSLACTEAEWQTEVTMNTFGLCGKFVIDDEGGTIRLPKYPNYFIAGLANIAPVVGNGLPLGLTQDGATTLYFARSGTSYTFGMADNGGSSLPSTVSNWTTGKIYDAVGVTTDPTKSGIEAQLDEKQIAGQYFIQVATGAETEDNIVNEIELNNPFSLLDYKFSEYELNNLSWLRSEGQYNSKAIYPAVYDLLLKIYNGTETKAGVSVKLHTDTSATDYDFRINTAEETFMLPIKVKLASGKAVVGNGMTLGLTDGTNTTGLFGASANGALTNYINLYGTAVGTTASGYNLNPNKSLGITTDPTKSGLELSDSDLYLYFYVGETVQNANLIDAGRIQEKVAECITRIDCKAYITETYQNGTSWYRIWSDGWCEQGGYFGSTVNNNNGIATLLKPFKDNNYNIQVTVVGSEGYGFAFSKTPTSIVVCVNGGNKARNWHASGFIA